MVNLYNYDFKIFCKQLAERRLFREYFHLTQFILREYLLDWTLFTMPYLWVIISFGSFLSIIITS